MLHLLVETPAAELAWAQAILSQHQDKPTLLSTHRYLFDWIVIKGRYGDLQYSVEPLYRHDGIKANDFFHNFVAVNKQIFMVYCGHCAGEYRQVSYNNYGLPVNEILADYQNGYGMGGNGWLRILRFQEDQDRIHGALNYGLAILPQRLSFNDDGIEICSSEWDTQVVRPSLDVEFTYTLINVEPTITSPLAADPTTVNEGDTVVLSMAAADPNPNDPLVFTINGVDVGYATGSGSIAYNVIAEDEGTYPFTGTVADDEVIVPAGEALVTAYNVDPTIIELTNDLMVVMGKAFDIFAEATDPGIWDELTYAWDCDNDGFYDDVIGATGTWSFAKAGLYPLRVEVLDGDGGAAYGEFFVRVFEIDSFVDPSGIKGPINPPSVKKY